MNIRSKQLLIYLLENNIDFQDMEALTLAKKEYRKLYKKRWKKHAKRNRELRPCFTEYEFQELCKRANLFGLPPTSYVRELILTNQENRELISNRSALLQALQGISMALMVARKEGNEEIKALLEQSEYTLIVYLK
jgi:hypothetical protein